MSSKTDRATRVLVALGLSASLAGAAGAERSYPLDCLPDRAAAWNPVAANPNALFGAAYVPGIVLGPPGDSAAWEGSVSVAALGFGGSVTVAFDTIEITDGPGPDFIVFENAFFRQPVPTSPTSDFRIFGEPGIVQVSPDGSAWWTFPYDARALADSAGHDLTPASYAALIGLAGLTPTFTGNWTVPDDPLVFDPAGTGGVSGAGGDAFDLAAVGLDAIRYVRIVDAGTHNGFPGAGEGFDLDAVIALHGRPVAPALPDADGDRLSDGEELELYGSNPALADSDADGVDDGREVAGCRSPTSASSPAVFHGEPQVFVLGKTCTELRWSFAGTGKQYDAIRGDLSALAETAAAVDLGPLSCLSNDDADLRAPCDPTPLAAGQGFFYLVRVKTASDYGRGSSLLPRLVVGGCP